MGPSPGFMDTGERIEKALAQQKWCDDQVKDSGLLRSFPTGASRDTNDGKLDLEGFLSPLVLERYAAYMHTNRKMRDGSFRDSDDWQQGIPKDVYMKSAWRHFLDWWLNHRGHRTKDSTATVLCALLFNVMGYLHEFLKEEAWPRKCGNDDKNADRQ